MREPLIQIRSLILAFANFKSFNLELISCDLCKTVERASFVQTYCVVPMLPRMHLGCMEYCTEWILWICAAMSLFKEAFLENKSCLKSIFSKDNNAQLFIQTATCSCGEDYHLDYTILEIRSKLIGLKCWYKTINDKSLNLHSQMNPHNHKVLVIVFRHLFTI